MKAIAVCLLPLVVTVLAAADVNEGKAIYEKACRSCHGAEGAGNPAIAKAMKVTLRQLGSPEVQGKTDDELRKIIVEGTGKMKPVTKVPKDRVADAVAFVRSLAKR